MTYERDRWKEIDLMHLVLERKGDRKVIIRMQNKMDSDSDDTF